MLEKLLERLPGGARLSGFFSELRSSYWFVPGLILLGATLLSFLMIFIDESANPDWIGELGWLYTNEPAGARELLSTVASSMITVAGVTFSITIVALTLASSQYGPRLLRNFMRDTGNQIVLGTFVSTFLYCLLILRTIRDTDDSAFVPHLSIALALLLAVLGLGVFIYFIHHMATSLQASTLITRVGTELEKAIDRLYPQRPFFPEAIGHEPPEKEAVALPENFRSGAALLPATVNGYMEAINNEGLMALAAKHDLLVHLERRPGDFVMRGQAVMAVWPADRLSRELVESLQEKLFFGPHRNQDQDVAFLFEQLVEIAMRALSTGIDDPLTATLCIDRIGAALSYLAERTIPSPYRYDDAQRLRVVAFPLTFAEAVHQTLSSIRRHSQNKLIVLLRLLGSIEAIAGSVWREEDRQALRQEAKLILAGAGDLLEEDRAELEQAYQRALAALTIR